MEWWRRPKLPAYRGAPLGRPRQGADYDAVMLNEWLNTLLALVASVDPVARTLLMALDMLLETSVLVGLFMPGDVVLLVASTAVRDVPEGVALAIAAIVGSLAGETIGFSLGRWLGPKANQGRVGRWIGRHRIDRAERFLRERGGVAVFASRFLPVFHSVVPFVAGFSGMPYRRFIRWTMPACCIWSTAYVGFGAVTSAGYREASSELHWAGAAFVAVVALGAAAMWWLKRRLGRLTGVTDDATKNSSE